jgi:hypothetical protein
MDASKSLIFILKANVEDFNKKVGDSERNFKRSFGNIQSVMLSVGKTFAVAAAGMVAALSVIVVKSINFADELVDIADAVGLTIDEVQKLNYALKLEGMDASRLLPIMKFLSAAIVKAGDSQAAATEETIAFDDAFTRLGINLATFKTLSPADQIDTLFRAIANVSNANERATLTTAIFGRAGMDLLPVIQTWTEKQEKLNKLLKDFGFSEDQLRGMAGMKDDMEIFKIALGYIGMDLAKTLMPAVKEILPYLTTFAQKFAEMATPKNIENLKEITKDFLKIGDAILWVVEKLLELNHIIGGILHPDWAPLFAPESMKNRNLFKSSIPAAQSGGIFTRPTLAMIGEGGPEAVMPLSSLGSMGNFGGGGTVVQNFHFAGFITDEMTLRNFARKMESIQRQEGNRSSFGPSKTDFYSQGGHL